MTHSRQARTLFEWCSHSVSVLWGANCFNTSTFLLISWAGLFKVVFPMSLWYELTALYCFDEPRISCEIHIGRQRSYRCSYKMILWRKHVVYQSTTPFQTERYSRPRHLAASFPCPAHTKNRKTSLPNHPIHWRTLYLIFPWWYYNIHPGVLSTCLHHHYHHHHHHLLIIISLPPPNKMFDWMFVPVCSVSKTLNGMVTLQSICELPRQQTYKNTAVITWGQCTYCYNLCCYTCFCWGNFKHTWVSCNYEYFFFILLFWFHHIIHAA